MGIPENLAGYNCNINHITKNTETQIEFTTTKSSRDCEVVGSRASRGTTSLSAKQGGRTFANAGLL